MGLMNIYTMCRNRIISGFTSFYHNLLSELLYTISSQGEYMSLLMTKPTKWLCAQRRLRSAWASALSDQSLLCTQWVAKDPSFLCADSEDSDQTGQNAQADPSLHWAHMPFCWFCHEATHIKLNKIVSSRIFITEQLNSLDCIYHHILVHSKHW